MKSLKRKWRKILIYFLRLYRAFDLGITSARETKTKQDRMIIKVVSSVLDSAGAKVYYSPRNSRGPKVYIHTKDKRYIITMTKTQVSITNHKFFFNSYITDQMAESLINLALTKLEDDLKRLDSEIVSNEDNFLGDLYETFKKRKEKDPPSKIAQIDQAFNGII